MDKVFRNNSNFISMGSPHSCFWAKPPEYIVFFEDLYFNLGIPAFFPCMDVSPVSQGNCLMPQADPKNRNIDFPNIVKTKACPFHIRSSAQDQPVRLFCQNIFYGSYIGNNFRIHVKIPDSPVNKVAKLPVIIYNKDF